MTLTPDALTVIHSTGREVTATRLFDAPVETVYTAWTTPEQIAVWWGPDGFTNTVYEMDVRPGGVWRYMMHGPDGVDYPNKILYTEVVPLKRLVYVHTDDIEDGGNRFDVTVDFEALGTQTKITMHLLFKSEEMVRDLVEKFGALDGLKQNMERLQVFLCFSQSR
ncbi:ATPase [bacterium]|nr:ATPase [bacterium]